MTNSTVEECKSKNTKSSVGLPKAEIWERTAIGEFLLKLYHRKELSCDNGLLITKISLRNKFTAYLELKENEGTKKKFKAAYGNNLGSNLGKSLHSTGFLKDTARGSEYYQIKNISLFTFRNEKLKEWDEMKMNRNDMLGETLLTQKLFNSNTISCDGIFKTDPALTDYLKVADNTEYHLLAYEGSKTEMNLNIYFKLSSMGCFICQCNFESDEMFEKHVEWHGDGETEFESSKELKKLNASHTQLSYATCKNSHYFCFALDTKEENLIIERIIIVRSNSFYYVNKNEFSLDKANTSKFFVDSHLFTNNVIQPIVVVFHYKSNAAIRVIEQHHFWRTEEFPKVNFAIRSNRLPHNSTFKTIFRLQQYMPQDEKSSELPLDLSLRECEENGKHLTMTNIDKALKGLLQIEDMDVIKRYSSLVQHNVVLRRYDQNYSVKVTNRSRNMVDDILTPYDEVIVIVNDPALGDNAALENKCKSRNRNEYFGIVDRVTSNRVTFICDQKINEEKVHKIMFRPSRITFRYQYRALQSLSTMMSLDKERILFPKLGNNGKISSMKLELFNSSIAENPEQYQAVRNIAEGPTKTATYIIFGPPGTGKTTTLVESVLQLYKIRPDTRILITAGSNSACDEVALRLCKVLAPLDDNRAIVRIFAKSNEKRLDNIDDTLIEASNMYGAHFYPSVDVLHAYRIIVCTLSVIGKLSTGNFGRGGIYTHIFVDEAAASTEVETLVGICNTVSLKAHVIISGDHKQLGPVLQSERARNLGLDVSLMERLLNRDCYKVDEHGNYNNAIQTRLKRNYRSHPQIVQLYNELYYNSELIPEAKGEDVNMGKCWHFSPNPDFPIIFHSVFGSCGDRSSASLSNAKEIDVVMSYVKDLMCFGINGQKIEQSDIGIISPYKKQYLRIQEELNLRHLYNIETGSVETFQGKEKHVILVSFVRSFTPTIGFLDNPRRLNVTLSRAKSLLILIGNPQTLSQNDDFKRIIEKCRECNTVVGQKIENYTQFNNGSDNKSNRRHSRKSTKNQKKKNDKKNQPQGTFGKQMKKGKQAQRQQNKERIGNNSIKNSLDLDLLLDSLPDVPNNSSPFMNKQPSRETTSIKYLSSSGKPMRPMPADERKVPTAEVKTFCFTNPKFELPNGKDSETKSSPYSYTSSTLPVKELYSREQQSTNASKNFDIKIAANPMEKRPTLNQVGTSLTANLNRKFTRIEEKAAKLITVTPLPSKKSTCPGNFGINTTTTAQITRGATVGAAGGTLASAKNLIKENYVNVRTENPFGSAKSPGPIGQGIRACPSPYGNSMIDQARRMQESRQNLLREQERRNQIKIAEEKAAKARNKSNCIIS